MYSSHLSQCYCVNNLHSTNHYTINLSDIKKWKKRAVEKRIAIIEYSLESNHSNDFIQIVNDFSKVPKWFEIPSMNDMLLKKIDKEKVGNRGNQAMNFGFNAVNRYYTDSYQLKQPMRFINVNHMDLVIVQEYVKYKELLSKITKYFHEKAFNDSNRQQLTKSPGFETLTFSLLAFENCVSMHKDIMNDDNENYNYTTVISKGVIVNDIFKRFAVIGYTRKSIAKYLTDLRERIGKHNIEEEIHVLQKELTNQIAKDKLEANLNSERKKQKKSK